MSKKVLISLVITVALFTGALTALISRFYPFSWDKDTATSSRKQTRQTSENKPFDPRGNKMEVNYRGLRLWLDKELPHLTEAQAMEIEEIVLNEQPPSHFATNSEINAFYFTLKVPGHNGSTGGYTETPIGVFTSFCVQVPYKPLYRFVVYRADTEEGPWEKFADFRYKTSSFPRIGFEIRGDSLVCVDKHQKDKIMYSRQIR